MTVAQFVALLAAMFAISAAPGPSDLLVVGRSITAGFSHGVAVTVGVIAADYVFILVALFSLGFVANEFSGIFAVIRYSCGAALISIGIATWWGRDRDATVRSESSRSLAASFAAGFLTTVADPKAILFYLSLLPAFVDMTAVTWRIALLVMGAATLTIASIKLSYALLSVRAKAYLENRSAHVKTSAVSAAAAIIVGVYLLLPG